MTPLPLASHATQLAGFPENGRYVFRLVDPKIEDLTPSHVDAALVKDFFDLQSALDRSFKRIIQVGEVKRETVAPTDLLFAALHNSQQYLSHGDIIRLDVASRRVRTLYRRSSRHNYFLVTERCNHYCLMCSQPPRDIDDDWLLDEIECCSALLDSTTPLITFTGGEPFLQWKRFIPLVGAFSRALTSTKIHVLTNGRAFSNPEAVKAWSRIATSNVSVGIPLYSSVDIVHDYIVQSKGAFDETVHGILRLKDRGLRTEIRVVLHALTIPALLETCKWLARNLPFVDHVALMGLENTGFALANQNELWIDPQDYRDELARAVKLLSNARMSVSVYNLPRCVIDPSVWSYAVQSISDWKNAFLPECDNCDEKSRCGGFFSTGRPRFSRGVRAICANNDLYKGLLS